MHNGWLVYVISQVRFALGPYLLNGSDNSDNSDGKKQSERRGVSQDPERAPLLGNAQPGQTLSVYANGQGDGQAEQPEDGAVKATAKQAGYKIADFCASRVPYIHISIN